jgi:uncharacterized RDD family membrane protein YckC
VTTPTGRAGLVTRAIAAVVDAAIVAGSTVLVYVALAVALFAWSPLDFRWPAPAGPVSASVFLAVATAYLTAGWARTGRTRGASLLGIRVVTTGLRPLGWGRAAVRAVGYVVFPVGLLWSAVSSSRRSLQDVLVGSVVVYDWHRDGGARLAEAEVRLPEPHDGPATPPG